VTTDARVIRKQGAADIMSQDKAMAESIQDPRETNDAKVDLQEASLDAVLRALDTTRAGLSAQEASERLRRFGANSLPEPKTNPLRQLLRFFWGPIPWMIEVAAVLSALVHHWAEFAIITVLLMANALVGFWEEFQAGNTLAALKAHLAPRARIRRDGAWSVIPSRELVPGDVVRLRMGDILPADVRLLDDEPIQVDQSALTGESLPVTHGSGDAVFSGSVLKKGETVAVVYATGPDTYFGRTARLVVTGHDESHFQRAVLKIGDYLIALAMTLVGVILVVALFRADDLITTLQFALVLTVAAIPVAMPAVLSVTMAVGARILTAGQAIVTRLAAIEELAGVDILCSDKTGTLTQNRLTLGEPFMVAGHLRDEVMMMAALASNPQDKDPIDDAIIAGIANPDELAAYRVTTFHPFDPASKRTEAEVTGPGTSAFRVTKGAPQVILEMTVETAAVKSQLEKTIDDFAARGYRALGVARRDGPGSWRFLGMIPLYDPPRVDSQETVAAAQRLGVKVKMVTGDQCAIGKEIARQIGLGDTLLDASSLDDASHRGTSSLAEIIERADGFAQVLPEHKYRIVDVLQKRRHIVGMTGDGVNDAPALQKADVGIAVSGATDVARASADIVLLAPGLSIIVDAIRESRRIFQRMRSYAIYRITETIRVLLFMTFSILAFHFYPVTAVMIVLLALLNDGAILSIASDNAEASSAPETWRMPTVLGVATMLGILGVIESFGLFYLCERVFHLSRDIIQSIIYLKLSVSGHLTIFVTRTRGPFWSSRPSPVLFWAVVGTQLAATLITVFGLFMSPIGWKWALLVWGYALFWFLAEDRLKPIAYQLFDHDQPGMLTRRHSNITISSSPGHRAGRLVGKEQETAFSRGGHNMKR
jgi:H+-transporting ATPase